MANYLEDYEVGQTFGSGMARVEADRMTAFAAEFDPQPFHLGDQGAGTPLRCPGRQRLVHGGNHHEAAGRWRPQAGRRSRGPGLRRASLAKPVRPGDELRLLSEILDVRTVEVAARSRADQGADNDDEPGGGCRADHGRQPSGPPSGNSRLTVSPAQIAFLRAVADAVIRPRRKPNGQDPVRQDLGQPRHHRSRQRLRAAAHRPPAAA